MDNVCGIFFLSRWMIGLKMKYKIFVISIGKNNVEIKIINGWNINEIFVVM